MAKKQEQKIAKWVVIRCSTPNTEKAKYLLKDHSPCYKERDGIVDFGIPINPISDEKEEIRYIDRIVMKLAENGIPASYSPDYNKEYPQYQNC